MSNVFIVDASQLGVSLEVLGNHFVGDLGEGLDLVRWEGSLL